MKSRVMGETTETDIAVPPPSLLATIVAHLSIGFLVVAVTKAIFKQKLTIAIVGGILAVVVHGNFDAPLARKLSDLGF
jgi:hypothetical protein